jgi:hypothetical protein
MRKGWNNSDIWKTVTNRHYKHEDIKGRFKAGYPCCHPVQNFVSSSLLSKILKIKIHRIIILPVVLYGCETLSVTLREEHKLRVFEDRVLRKIVGSKKDEVTRE